uniref:Zinc finger C5HC2-type domain-containing protein n=1 Tax=Arundo donax TaxID=35708 RepID=A0A0A9FPC1_ARUDO
MELKQRQNICSPYQSRKMDAEFDSTDRECALCYYDLHLSASGCSCCPEKYACLAHAKQLCSCDWDKRFLLFRYDLNELNILADALAGKLSAIHRWGVSDLGLSLSSCVKQEKVQDSRTVHRSTDGPRRSYMSHASTVSLVPSFVCTEQQNNENKMLNSASPVTNNVCPSAEQIKLGNFSPLKEPCVKNELCCTPNNGISQLQYNGVPGGHTNSASSLSVPSGQSFSSNVVTRSLSNSGESMKSAHGLAIFEESIESSRFGNCTSSLDEHHNRPPILIDHGTNMKPSFESKNNSYRLMASNRNATLCHPYKDQELITPEINASVMTEKDSSQAHTASSQQFAKTVSRAKSASQEASASVFASKPLVENTYGCFSSGSGHLRHPTFGNQQPNDGWLETKSEPLSGLEIRPRGHSAVLVHPALGNHNRSVGVQKGPRMANVVHRFKCSVEPLEIGYVLSGKLWSSSQAIFPKGFRSRVKYFSIVDPMQMAYYISEILDAGLYGPLFMVTVENCPGEVFINVSPTKCWNMVRERLNMEIRRQNSMGRANLPTLQPPGSVDGLEMFGLLSPAIVQAIEARDRDRICTEYWRSNPHVVFENRDSRHMPPQGPPHIALRGLFQRANREELQALRSLLMSNSNMDDSTRQQSVQILDEEIAKQWC